jgi:hypothetical protein
MVEQRPDYVAEGCSAIRAVISEDRLLRQQKEIPLGHIGLRSNIVEIKNPIDYSEQTRFAEERRHQSQRARELGSRIILEH